MKRGLSVFVLLVVLLSSIPAVFSVNTAQGYHPLQQISKTSGDSTSVDADSNGEIDSATYAASAGSTSYAASAGTASYAASAGSTSYAASAGTASYAASAGSASYASNAETANYATSSGTANSANSIVGISPINKGYPYTSVGNDGGNGWPEFSDTSFSSIVATTLGGYSAASFPKWNTWEYSTYHSTDGNIYLGWAGMWLSTKLHHYQSGCYWQNFGTHSYAICANGYYMAGACATNDFGGCNPGPVGAGQSEWASAAGVYCCPF